MKTCIDCGINIFRKSKRCRSCAHQGRNLSEETHRKSVEGHKGKRHSLESRRKISMWHKGKPLSEETRWRMSKAHRGTIASAEIRNKISEGQKGHTVSLITRSKISAANKGRSFSAEVCRKRSDAVKGDKNPSWRGGISYLLYPPDFDAGLKLQIRGRDHYKCQFPDCGKNASLYVHHIDYDKQNNNQENLITLCNSCHSKVNFNRGYWAGLFQGIMLGLMAKQ